MRLITRARIVQTDDPTLNSLYDAKADEFAEKFESLKVEVLPMVIANPSVKVSVAKAPDPEPYQTVVETIVMIQVCYMLFWKIWNNSLRGTITDAISSGKWSILWTAIRNLRSIRSLVGDIVSLGTALWTMLTQMRIKQLGLELYELFFTTKGIEFQEYVRATIRGEFAEWYNKNKEK